MRASRVRVQTPEPPGPRCLGPLQGAARVTALRAQRARPPTRAGCPPRETKAPMSSPSLGWTPDDALVENLPALLLADTDPLDLASCAAGSSAVVGWLDGSASESAPVPVGATAAAVARDAALCGVAVYTDWASVQLAPRASSRPHASAAAGTTPLAHARLPRECE